MADRKGLISAIRGFFTEVPPRVPPEGRRIYFLYSAGMSIGFGAHMLMLVAFWAFGVWPMALFNVLSVSIFATGLVVNRRGRPALSMMMGMSEIMVHQPLAVYFVGWEAGFQYYLPMIAVFGLSLPVGRLLRTFFGAVLPLCVYLGLFLTLRDAAPIFPIPGVVAIHATNFCIAFGVLALLPPFFRSAAADELRASHALDQLAEHDRLKSRFFANVSHELRTPLTLITTPLRRLLDGEHGDVPEEVQAQHRAMQGNAQRLLRQVNQLLDLSAIESGSATVAYEERDIGRFAEGVVDGFEAFARSKGLSLALRGPDDLPKVLIDPEKLDKVLCNLLSNACKFTPAGGSVMVRLCADERSLQIAVKDSGCGIAEEDRERVFERFQQLDDAASRQHEGSGIGLALARELTELMGGRLTLESELGFGSTFTVHLPLGRAHIKDPASIRSASAETEPRCSEVAVAALAAEAGTTAAPETGKLDEKDERPLVLVVEDNPDMRRLVAGICAAEFRVQEAADGEQALRWLSEHRPDLVITDVMMPRMDGRELLRRVRQDPATATLPMMLLTARAGEELRLEGLEQGADDYLVKPFESRELLARARNLVRLQQQERELRELNLGLKQEVVDQAAALQRARALRRYLPPQVARSLLEQGQAAAPQERRRISVFLLELTGFDQLLARLEPEEMAPLLNSYLSEMVELAFSHGATVDRFDRDRIRGFFGAPLTEGAEQDAARCATLARALWERACDVTGRWRGLVEGPPPSPTLVLTTGFATVGSFGSSSRMDYAAVGGAVDLAAALLGRVGPGQAVCTGATWKLIEGEAEFVGEACGEVELPGQTGPVRLYRLAGPAGTLRAEQAPAVQAPGEAGNGEPAPGKVIGGRYEVVRELGAGGMGQVLLVNDRKLELEVALKLLRADLHRDPESLARLRREVRLARLVSHENVARIFDLGEWAGREFITMEYLRGSTLEREVQGAGPLALDRGLAVMRGLCAGLSAAHAAGVIHRDLKPQNVMLEPCGRVVILDFGIARPTNGEERSLTGEGVLGTPRYMAPEQIEGGRVDARTDIYALGLVSFELFTGWRPFEAQGKLGDAMKRLHQEPPDPLELRVDLPPMLGAVILRCLRRAPADRFATADEVASMLASVEAADRGA